MKVFMLKCTYDILFEKDREPQGIPLETESGVQYLEMI